LEEERESRTGLKGRRSPPSKVGGENQFSEGTSRTRKILIIAHQKKKTKFDGEGILSCGVAISSRKFVLGIDKIRRGVTSFGECRLHPGESRLTGRRKNKEGDEESARA